VYATLLDEGEYLCSIRSMYRLLRRNGASRERPDQLAHPQLSLSFVFDVSNLSTTKCFTTAPKANRR
jgi:hypothetical protein